jgi:hypothetical protein
MDDGRACRGSDDTIEEEFYSSCRVAETTTSSARVVAGAAGVGVNCSVEFVGGVSGTVDVDACADGFEAGAVELELLLISVRGVLASPLPKGFLFRIDFCVAIRTP